MIKALGEVVEGDWEGYLESILGRRNSRCKGPETGQRSVWIKQRQPGVE